MCRAFSDDVIDSVIEKQINSYTSMWVKGMQAHDMNLRVISIAQINALIDLELALGIISLADKDEMLQQFEDFKRKSMESYIFGLLDD